MKPAYGGNAKRMKKLQDFLDIPTTDPETAVRRKLLKIMTITVFLAMVAAIIVDLITGPEIFPYILAMLAILGGIYFISHSGYDDPASLIFVIFLVVMATFLRTFDERIAITYMIPILVAGVTFRPWSGFVIAACCSILLVYPVSSEQFPVAPTAIVFLTVAAIVWVYSRGYDKARHQLMELNQDLERIVEDRTEDLRKAQDELLLKEKLAVLGQLSGGISHELRSPLSSIKGASDLLTLEVGDYNPEVKDAIETIDKAVASSVKTIESLLGFAQPKEPKLEHIEINRVLEDSTSLIEKPDNIEVVEQFDTSLPKAIADAFQLKHAFSNVLLNAVQAMPDGGTLTLKTSSENGWITVEICDTGIGIAEENLDKLFQPLFTTKVKGVGLGLTITKMLVEAQKGSIVVESRLGEGCTFKIKLPAA